jgi:alkylation response protein AidB-like acyl-CoA dehydrogenase
VIAAGTCLVTALGYQYCHCNNSGSSVRGVVDVGLSAEQEALASAVAALATDITARWTPGRGPDTVASCVPDPQTWQAISTAGLLGLRTETGDAGASCLDACVVVEQFARHCTPVPVLGTLLLVEQLRLRGAAPDVLERVGSGALRAAVTLTGDLREFADGVAAARSWDCAGADLAVVAGPDTATGYRFEEHRAADVTRAWGEIDAAGTAESLGELAPASPDTTARLTAFALTVLCADLLGVMQAALDSAVDHARNRRQFGVPIGSFQAVAHLAAEALVSVEATRSAVWYSAWATDTLPAGEAAAVARAAKAFASANAVAVAETAVQIHGGMGMTWEAGPHLWLRRAQTTRRVLGDEHHQYGILAGERLGAGERTE